MHTCERVHEWLRVELVFTESPLCTRYAVCVLLCMRCFHMQFVCHSKALSPTSATFSISQALWGRADVFSRS